MAVEAGAVPSIPRSSRNGQHLRGGKKPPYISQVGGEPVCQQLETALRPACSPAVPRASPSPKRADGLPICPQRPGPDRYREDSCPRPSICCWHLGHQRQRHWSPAFLTRIFGGLPTRQHPGIRLKIVKRRSASVLSMLCDSGAVDIAFASSPTDPAEHAT